MFFRKVYRTIWTVAKVPDPKPQDLKPRISTDLKKLLRLKCKLWLLHNFIDQRITFVYYFKLNNLPWPRYTHSVAQLLSPIAITLYGWYGLSERLVFVSHKITYIVRESCDHDPWEFPTRYAMTRRDAFVGVKSGSLFNLTLELRVTWVPNVHTELETYQDYEPIYYPSNYI